MMVDILDLIENHVEKYPLMMPCDVVKIVFQSEFGGGHLVKDRESCCKRIELERSAGTADSRIPLYEDIGGGYVRVNVNSAPARQYSSEVIADAFIESSEHATGNIDSFIAQLRLIEDNFEKFDFSFTKADFKEHIDSYIADGAPVVSHSEIYKREYKPAYRVIAKEIFEKRFK